MEKPMSLGLLLPIPGTHHLAPVGLTYAFISSVTYSFYKHLTRSYARCWGYPEECNTPPACFRDLQSGLHALQGCAR